MYTAARQRELEIEVALRQLRSRYGKNVVHPASRIARMALCSPRTAKRYLDALARVGIASVYDDGRCSRYRLSDRQGERPLGVEAAAP